MNLNDLPRINVAQLRDLQGQAKPARRKYRNIPTDVDGIRFDSRAEATRWAELNLLLKTGRIRNLQRQVRYVLVPAQKRPSGGVEREKAYVADFVFDELHGTAWRTVVEDVKGAEPAIWGLKRALMLHVHGIEIRVIKR